MAKLYDTEIGDRIKERLKQLEKKAKPPAKAPARAIIDRFKDAARQALTKGYSLEEIRQIAQDEGLEVSVATLQTYLRKKFAKSAPAVRRRPPPVDSPPADRAMSEPSDRREA